MGNKAEAGQTNRHKKRRTAEVVVVDGCINYLFPFSFQRHLSVKNFRSQHRQMQDPEHYCLRVKECVALLSRRPGILFGLTWLPTEDWNFSPWKFNPAGDLSPLSNSEMMAVAASGSVDEKDLAAMAANDGFFFLAEYLRRQPVVRMRLSGRAAAAVLDVKKTSLIQEATIDLTLHLATGQGCLILRHPLNGLSVDAIIGMRLTQFRRGISYRWLLPRTESAAPEELQDLYVSLGRDFFGPAFVPTFDVRQYAAVVEVRDVREGSRLLKHDQIRKTNPKWLYGLLNVDERWRDIDSDRAGESLGRSISHTEYHRQYCQPVTLLVLHSVHGSAGFQVSSTPNLLDFYYWNLRENLDRTVSDRCCTMEALMAQENLLVNMYEDYRSQVWTQTPSRAAIQRLRKAMIVSRQEADESFNVLPGEDLMTEVRGLARWRLRIQEASSTLDMVLEEYHKYHSELLEDIGAAAGVGLSVFSILFSLEIPPPESARLGVSVGFGFLALSRLYKFRDKVTAVLTAVWVLLLLALWIGPGL